jgi:2-polyprenyl-3-methyl-5-hydroxy-6-metoxy-1,4-benzoquinol methylase
MANPIPSPPEIDATRCEAFAERLMGALNESAMIAMVSVGHRTGLFDAMAGRVPSTSEEIAEAAGLDERYVREWLAVMVTSRVVEYTPDDRRYHLPPEHAAWLTRAASPDNFAVTAQMLPSLGAVESELVECFRRGGGLAYDCYPRFHEVMAEDSGQTVVAVLFDRIVPLVPGLDAALERGIRVLDVGCGRGRALLRLAERYPRSRFEGIDLCEEPIRWAREQASSLGLENVRFEARDATAEPLGGPFDWITTFDAVHDQADPEALLRRIAEALSPEGVYLMQDIAGSSHLERNLDHPAAPFCYAISTAHCMSVSLAQGGAGLGTMWGEECATRMLAEAGFGDVRTHRLDHDPLNVFYVARPSLEPITEQPPRV